MMAGGARFASIQRRWAVEEGEQRWGGAQKESKERKESTKGGWVNIR